MATTLIKHSNGVAPEGAVLELCYYYGAGGQFQRVVKVASIEEAERNLAGKHYHSAELFEPGSHVPVKSWERGIS